MSEITPRQFAVDVVRRLQEANYQGLWAGGCVRDQLIGRVPKDFDVATNARPDQIRELFGHKRTIAIGAAFGVITVIGPKSAGNIEIATFRRDAEYSDGRRPDGVVFTDAKEDAMRRDFTINGMFYDPISDDVIDYVDGRADIDCRVVRAIGDPHERISEDKLRMLRAVRFAATFDFDLEPETQAAVTEHAHEVTVVSGERIGSEMRRMLAHPNRARAAELLNECALFHYILQDGERLAQNRANWRTRLQWLDELGENGDFEQAAAVLLSKLIKEQGVAPTAERWKLSNSEQKTIEWIEQNLLTLTRIHRLPWSHIQPLLIHADASRAIDIARVQFGPHHPGVKKCAERLSWPPERLNPNPLVEGADLIKSGLRPGPMFKKIIEAVRNAQLDGEVETKEQALELAARIVDKGAEPCE